MKSWYIIVGMTSTTDLVVPRVTNRKPLAERYIDAGTFSAAKFAAIEMAQNNLKKHRAAIRKLRDMQRTDFR